MLEKKCGCMTLDAKITAVNSNMCACVKHFWISQEETSPYLIASLYPRCPCVFDLRQLGHGRGLPWFGVVNSGSDTHHIRSSQTGL